MDNGARLSNLNCQEDCDEMDEMTGLRFRTGRVDCGADGPFSDDLEDMEQREFPNPNMSAEEVFAYYARTDGPGFDLTSDEVLAH